MSGHSDGCWPSPIRASASGLGFHYVLGLSSNQGEEGSYRRLFQNGSLKEQVQTMHSTTVLQTPVVGFWAL